VTSRFDIQLRQFDAAGGDELRRVGLPDYMDPLHAVESPTGTFIVCHETQLKQWQVSEVRTEGLKEWQVSEVSTEGQVLRQFSFGGGLSGYIAVDRQGNMFVAHTILGSILLLDAQLALRRVLTDACQQKDRMSERLCYLEQSGQLLVGLENTVAVFDVLRR